MKELAKTTLLLAQGPNVSYGEDRQKVVPVVLVCCRRLDSIAAAKKLFLYLNNLSDTSDTIFNLCLEELALDIPSMYLS